MTNIPIQPYYRMDNNTDKTSLKRRLFCRTIQLRKYIFHYDPPTLFQLNLLY